MKPLYVKDVIKEENETVVSYLTRLCNYQYGFPTTYYSPDYAVKECSLGKNRSLDAIYQVCLSEFPELTHEEFFKSIKEFIQSSNFRKSMILCDDIDKWVIFNIYGEDDDVHYDGLVYDYKQSQDKIYHFKKGTFCAQQIIDA